MKGLIKKDYLLGKKFFLIGIGLFLAMLFFAYLVRFAFIYGNLQYLSSEDIAENIPALDICFTLLPPLLLMVLWLQAWIYPVFADIQCKWYLFCFSTSTTSANIVQTKYGELILTWIFGGLLASLSTLLYGNIFGFHYAKFGFYLYLILSLFFLLCSMCIIPLSYCYKTPDAVALRMVLCCLLPLYLAVGFLFLHFSSIFGEAKLLAIAKNWLLQQKFYLVMGGFGISILVLAVSYRISLNLINRRTLICGD